MLEMPAFEIKQHEFVFYSGYMQAKDLSKIKVDTYHPFSNPSGYQRILDEGRARLFRRYIKSPTNFSPPAITLSVRGKFEFKVKDPRTHYGILRISDENRVYVVDGQHRKEGLKN